jgi:hypothetical protein
MGTAGNEKGYAGTVHTRLDTVPGQETVQRRQTQPAQQADHALCVSGAESEGEKEIEILSEHELTLTYLIHVIIILCTKKFMVLPFMITCYDRL